MTEHLQLRNFPLPFIYSFIHYWFIHPCVCPAKAQCPLWPGPALTCRKGNQWRRKTRPPTPRNAPEGLDPTGAPVSRNQSCLPVASQAGPQL